MRGSVVTSANRMSPPSLKRLLLMRIEWTPVHERRIGYTATIDGIEHRLQINQLAHDGPFCTLSRGDESLAIDDAPDAWIIPSHPRHEGSA
jgi:hypothetical protein